MHAVFEQKRYLIPFRAALLPQIFADCLVIGGGVAGQRAALAAAEHGETLLINKGPTRESSTYYAQGGIAAVMADGEDSFEEHVRDTMAAGGGLCEEHVVRRVVKQARERTRELIDWGMPFDRADQGGGELSLGREGGHGRPRILHADGDGTGRVLVNTLAQRVAASERIRVFDECFVVDLITQDGSPPRCIGAVTHHPKYGLQVIWSKATILATGGCGQVFRETTNPAVATGDGIAMAYRAGVRLADLAFVQFHPTTLYIAGAGRWLITEAVRGEGAQLIDATGRRFMPDYHPDAELAPRDVVARAIVRQMAHTESAYAYLDARAIGSERFRERFPGIAAKLADFDIDPGRDPIPIHPSAHYTIGGAWTDELGRTNIGGLYACGEAACTGLHGANRLASNSLLEGLVFGEAAGRAAGEMVDETPPAPVKVISDIPISERSALDLADVRSSLRSVMGRHVGIERNGPRLAEVAEMFDFWARYTLDKIFDDRAGWETQNMLLIGALITRAARWRAESRGTHFRTDHPDPEDRYVVHDVWRRGDSEPEAIPVGAEQREARA